jgi:hypothetical protein
MVILRQQYHLEYVLSLSESGMNMKKIWIALITLTIGNGAMAEQSSLNLQLPSAGSVYGQDSIRTQEGLDCKNAIGGATQLEFGVTGIIDNYSSPFGGGNPDYPSEKDVGVYARIVIPLDGPKERINCNSLYELELRKKRIEVLKLQEELEALKKLNASGGVGFEN